jgi:hypothetical protein
VGKGSKGYGHSLRRYYSGVCLEVVRGKLQISPVMITGLLAEI